MGFEDASEMDPRQEPTTVQFNPKTGTALMEIGLAARGVRRNAQHGGDRLTSCEQHADICDAPFVETARKPVRLDQALEQSAVGLIAIAKQALSDVAHMSPQLLTAERLAGDQTVAVAFRRPEQQDAVTARALRRLERETVGSAQHRFVPVQFQFGLENREHPWRKDAGSFQAPLRGDFVVGREDHCGSLRRDQIDVACIDAQDTRSVLPRCPEQASETAVLESTNARPGADGKLHSHDDQQRFREVEDQSLQER
jgi:hypothetical protein